MSLAWHLAALSAAIAAPVPSAGGTEPPLAPYVWHNVAIGGGGFSPSIVFSVAEHDLAYLRTDVGGAYRWDAAQHRWIPLQDAEWQNSYLGIESIAPDPRDPNVVYLAAGMYHGLPSAIMRSDDRGRTWAVTPVPFGMGGNEDGRGLGERLAIDPNRTATLFFGSRHDGLWRSDDSGKIWRKVDGFPWPGLGSPQPNTTHGGVSFVVVDPASGAPGSAPRVIYAGVADPTDRHLIRSTDGGRSWQAVAGGPDATMLPVKAAIAADGILYIDYCTGIGPNGIANGGVWKLDPATGRWTNITPARGKAAEGGYMGLSLDRQRPGRLAVSTVDRWNHRDTVWLSTDGGSHWTSLREQSGRDVSAVPFLGLDRSGFGGWIAGLAFDPFDGGTLAYTTGATVYRTEDARKTKLLWRPWVRGVEESVALSMVSPTGGAHLITGIGDTRGFVHDDLDRSSAVMLNEPDLPHTNNVDDAGLAPDVLVRSASGYFPQPQGASLGWSDDGGHSWHAMTAPPIPVDGGSPRRIDVDGQAPIAVSADGATFVISGPVTLATADRGRSWWQPRGLPRDARAIADKTDPHSWYAIDYVGGRLFVSRDDARSFDRVPAVGLPADLASSRPPSREYQPAVQVRRGTAGELWLIVQGRLYRSTDFARTFAAIAPSDPYFRDMLFVTFGLGKPAPGADVPAIYAFGVKPTIGAMWRSIDGGVTWARINDDGHRWGLRYRVIAGDPRLFGRVYVSTDGRGIFYGDPADRAAVYGERRAARPRLTSPSPAPR